MKKLFFWTMLSAIAGISTANAQAIMTKDEMIQQYSGTGNFEALSPASQETGKRDETGQIANPVPTKFSAPARPFVVSKEGDERRKRTNNKKTKS